MRYVLSVVMLMISIISLAQDKTVTDLKSTSEKTLVDDTSHKQGWRKGVIISLGIAQGNSSNWAAGAEQSSLAVNSNVNLFATLKRDKIRWINNLDLFYALQTTTSQGTRKTDDRIDYYTKYTRTLSKKWGFGAVGNFRTQFTDGYDYSKDPYELTSGFFAPAYITIAPGFDWTPTEYFNVFLSPISARWTVVTKDGLQERYGLDPGESSRFEAGAFVSAIFKKDIMKNVNLRSRLDLYSNYLSNPQNVDIFWTNVLTLKVNKWLGVTYNFDLIYDDDVRLFGENSNAPRTQIKSLLSVGLTTRL
ncbi:MAG TPA: DUF3078 domain-containing protein [Chitinophagaceae bacterium]|nr:DUF3078 domain-containing protein [Chitinophagaceae bacterium]